MDKMGKLQLAPIIIGKLLNIGGLLQRQGNQITLPVARATPLNPRKIISGGRAGRQVFRPG